MTIPERLNTLFLLADMSNAKLARELHVDASLVSRWRNGTRKISGGILQHLAKYFAVQLSGAGQLDLLEHLLRAEGGVDFDEGDHAGAIRRWLSEQPSALDNHLPRGRHSPAQSGMTGWEGRIQAVQLLLEAWSRQPVAERRLLIYCDESLDWTDTAARCAACFAKFCDLADQIGSICLIVPKDLPAERSMVLMDFFFPLFRTSKLQVFGVEEAHPFFQNFAACVPGVGALCSVSYSGAKPVTAFVPDKGFVRQLALSLRALADSGEPLLRQHDRLTFAEMMEHRLQFFSYSGEAFYYGNAALFSMMPEELLYELMCTFAGAFGRFEEARARAKAMCAIVEEHLVRHRMLICAPLYTPGGVEGCAADLPSIPRCRDLQPVISPERYLSILERMLFLMETYPRYSFQRIDAVPHNYGIWLKPGNCLYVAANHPHACVYVSGEPVLVQGQYHSILSRYMAIPSDKRHRSYNLRLLRERISCSKIISAAAAGPKRLFKIFLHRHFGSFHC
jgi:transcriptional regulator with XRE-family HTH domain